MSTSRQEIAALFDRPFMELIYHAMSVHREHFDPNEIQISTLLSVKTGKCPEDCKYCSQSVRYDTELEANDMMSIDEVVAKAQLAKSRGSTRFCMGFAWRSVPKKSEFTQVLEMVKAVKDQGMETCLSMGMLNQDQCDALKEAGLDYVNHNLDTSPEYYKKVVTTRQYEDRLQTLACVSQAGIKVCCGGIMDMGETRQDRVGFFHALCSLDKAPESVPINRLMRVQGTPMADTKPQDDFEFVRSIAVSRLLFPKARIRLSAGRSQMNDQLQALCIMAGANSIFYGQKLLTCANPNEDQDNALFARLDLHAQRQHAQDSISLQDAG